VSGMYVGMYKPCFSTKSSFYVGSLIVLYKNIDNIIDSKFATVNTLSIFFGKLMIELAIMVQNEKLSDLSKAVVPAPTMNKGIRAINNRTM
jgi:hypothetical protein